MAKAYTPALQVSQRSHVTKLRELPLLGTALVKVGQTVRATDPVLSAELPGDLYIVRIADQLGIEPAEVLEHIVVKKGDHVEEGALLCERQAFFGLLRSEVRSPKSGTVEFITEATGHLGIRGAPTVLTVPAFLSGVVTQVEERKSVTIASDASFLQGIFGVSGERFGPVCVLPVEREDVVTPKTIKEAGNRVRGSIVVGGSAFTLEAIQECAVAGAVAIVTASIDSETLGKFVGHEIGVSVTGDEDVPLTLVITEGFGKLAMAPRTWELLRTLDGKEGAISGATQVRAGAIRPELIVPLTGAPSGNTETVPTLALEVGARVRCIRFPYFGELGTIAALPHEPERIGTGASVRVMRVKLDRGEEITIARANGELIA